MPDRSWLDWPFVDDEHRAFAAAFEAWTTSHFDQSVDANGGTRNLVRQLGADGWLRAVVPASHGGLRDAVDIRTICIARETIAYRSGFADSAFAMQGLGSIPITLAGTEDQRDRYLVKTAAGEAVAAFALSETVAGSDVAAMTTSAVRDGEDWVLDGEKTWISNAGVADYYIVFARTGQPGAKGISAFIVDAPSDGLIVGDQIPVMAPHPLGTLHFVGCRVADANRLGDVDRGFGIAMATLDAFRTTVGAAALGFARRALDEAAHRAVTRSTFGKPLAAHQLVQSKLAQMAVRIDASALLVLRAAWTKDTGHGRVTREASIAKLYATESAQEVVDAAVQLFGGLGVTSGQVVERLFREVRALRIYEGTSEIQELIIAGQLIAATRRRLAAE